MSSHLRFDDVGVKRLGLEPIHDRICVMSWLEKEYQPRHDYIEFIQRDGMNTLWRRKVYSWLMEFEDEYDISIETISVACNMIDRYLCEVSVEKDLFQLLAMAAIFVAAKLNEAVPISIDELKELADGRYHESDILLMESNLLQVINWKLNAVSPLTYAHHLVQFIKCEETRHLIYEDMASFIDLTIPEYEYLQFLPSTIAAAAILCTLESSLFSGSHQEVYEILGKYDLLSNGEVFICKETMMRGFHHMVVTPHPQENRSIQIINPQPESMANAFAGIGKRNRDSDSPVGVADIEQTWSSIDTSQVESNVRCMYV